MRKNIMVILIMIFFAVSFMGCTKGVPTPEPGEYLDISVDKVQELINTDKNLLILDVRTPEEYNSGHIPGAKLIPLDELESRIGELNKEQTIVTVCLSGERSGMAARFLAQNGFTKVYNMAGGMSVWKGQIEQ